MAHLNTFSPSTDALDMTQTDEFASLLASANDLGIRYSPGVAYRSRNAVVRHKRLHFLEWGDADSPPILLLHGGHQSAHSWDMVSLALADRFHVYALDQRGHGDSEWAHDGDYSPASMAEDALAFIELEGIERPIVFGHSMGGMVTMTILQRAPGVPRAAVLVDIGPEVDTNGTNVIRNFIRTSTEFDDIEAFVEKVAGYDPFRSREHIMRTVRYNMIQRVDGKYVSKCDSRFAELRERATAAPRVGLDAVSAFDLPVLVVRGEQSNVLTPEAAERFAATLPEGQLVTVPRCGHNVHSQNTPGFLEAIGGFLAANGR